MPTLCYILLFLQIVWCLPVVSQPISKVSEPRPVNVMSKTSTRPERLYTLTTELNFQDNIRLGLQRSNSCFFIVIENVFGELTRPDPAVNKTGFHYNANPVFEIEETKGNTGFVKIGMTLNFNFR